MKKLNVLSLAVLLSLSLGACGQTSEDPSSTPSTPSTPSIEDSTPVTDESTPTVEDSTPSESSPVESTPSESIPDPVVYVEAGTQESAIANPGHFYYEKDADTTVTGVVEDGVSKIEFDGATAYNSLVLHYEAPEVTTGSRYEISFNIKSSAVMQSVTVNGQVYELAKGDNTISYRFTESDAATLTIVVGDEANADFVTEKNTLEISTPVVTDVQYKTLTPQVDGDLSEWKETKNEENSIGVYGSDAYEGKGVTFYASLQSDGLYIAAEVFHGKYTTTAGAWWQNSNLEFFLGDANAQGWVSANGTTNLVDSKVWTTTGSDEEGYHTIVEGFVPATSFPAGSVVAGELRVGWAWKTEGDLCNNGEAAGGAEEQYWVPKGTWTNNADKSYVTKDGIFRKSQVAFELDDFKTVKLDGNLADWEGINGVTFQGTENTAHKDVTWYARMTDEGLFVAAKAHHDVFINESDAWHTSTNLEFWVNGNNQKFISARGDTAGGVYGTYTSVAYSGEAEYETVFECVIPTVYLDGLTGEDGKVTIGFAWKTNGDVTTGGGANNGGEDAWWILPGRDRLDPAQQFVVTAEGFNLYLYHILRTLTY